MYVTNGSLKDVKEWFYDEENDYTWFGMFLPSILDHNLLDEIIESIDSIDRLTRKNVALMTFLTAKFGRDDYLYEKYLHSKGKLSSGYRAEKLALAWSDCCVLNIEFSLLHTVRSQYKHEYQHYIDNHIKRDTTIIADNLREELNLDSRKSFLLLLCKYGNRDEFLKIPIDDNLSCVEIVELFQPFWSSISNVEYLRKDMIKIQFKIESINHTVSNLPYLSEVMSSFTRNINNYLKDTLNISQVYSINESNVSLRGKYIIINGKKVMLYKQNRRKLSKLMNEHNYRRKRAIARDSLETERTNLIEDYERVVEQLSEIEKLIKESSSSIKKRRLKKSWLGFIYNIITDLSVKFAQSMTT